MVDLDEIRQLHKRGLDREALDLLEPLLEKGNPADTADNWVLKGKILGNLGLEDHAREAFRKAVSRDPEHKEASWALYRTQGIRILSYPTGMPFFEDIPPRIQGLEQGMILPPREIRAAHVAEGLFGVGHWLPRKRFAHPKGPDIEIWDLVREEDIYTLKGAREAVTCLAHTRDGEYLAAAGGDRGVRVYELKKRTADVGRLLKNSPCRDLAWAADGSMLVGVGEMIHIWDVDDHYERYDIEWEVTPSSIAISEDSLLVGHQDGSINAWPLKIPEEDQWPLPIAVEGGWEVTAMDVDTDHRFLLTARGKKLELWDLENNCEKVEGRKASNVVLTAAFHPELHVVGWLDFQGEMVMWNLEHLFDPK